MSDTKERRTRRKSERSSARRALPQERITVRLNNLSATARRVLLAAGNRSEVARMALEDWAARRQNDELLRRVHALLTEVEKRLREQVALPAAKPSDSSRQDRPAAGFDPAGAGLLKWLQQKRAEEDGDEPGEEGA